MAFAAHIFGSWSIRKHAHLLIRFRDLGWIKFPMSLNLIDIEISNANIFIRLKVNHSPSFSHVYVFIPFGRRVPPALGQYCSVPILRPFRPLRYGSYRHRLIRPSIGTRALPRGMTQAQRLHIRQGDHAHAVLQIPILCLGPPDQRDSPNRYSPAEAGKLREASPNESVSRIGSISIVPCNACVDPLLDPGRRKAAGDSG